MAEFNYADAVNKASTELQKQLSSSTTPGKVVAANSVTSIQETGVTNTTGLGAGEYFVFFKKEEYENWRENGLLQVVHFTKASRSYDRLYVAVRSYRMASSGEKVAETVKFTDAGNLSKTEIISSVAPNEKGEIVDTAATRQPIEDNLNLEISSCYTPYDKVMHLAGSTIMGVLSERPYLQQKFDNRAPVANTYIARKIALPRRA